VPRLKPSAQRHVQQESHPARLRLPQVAAAQADVRAQEAELRAAAIKQQSDYFVVSV